MVNLMEFGLERLAVGNWVERGQLVTYLPVSNGETTDVPAVTGSVVRTPLSGERFEQAVLVDKAPEAPIAVGDVIGAVQYFVDGAQHREIPLLAAATVEAASEAALVASAGLASSPQSVWQLLLKILLW